MSEDFSPIIAETILEDNMPGASSKIPTNVLIFQLCFMAFIFLEAFLTGLVPTWSRSCRESPRVLGYANAFAGGVFLAIAFCHIMPEAAGGWTDMWNSHEPPYKHEEPFPLPYLLVFVGYTIILLLDKVLFDTHVLFEGEELGHTDPAV